MRLDCELEKFLSVSSKSPSNMGSAPDVLNYSQAKVYHSIAEGVERDGERE